MKEILKEAYERFIKYEMDVDSEAPSSHKDFMKRLKSCINDVSTTENIEKQNDCNAYREYEKHEFCLAMRCSWLKKGECRLKPGCCHSARGLHVWLKENGFKIVKNKD